MFKKKIELTPEEIHDLICYKQYQQKVSISYAFLSTQTLYIFGFLTFFHLFDLKLLWYFEITTWTDVATWTVIFVLGFYRKFLNVKKINWQELPIIQKLIGLKERASL